MADKSPISPGNANRKSPTSLPLSPTPTAPTSKTSTTIAPPSPTTAAVSSNAHPGVPAPIWPPPETRSRAPEFYGFVAWTTTYILFILYLLWAITPDEWIVQLGVTWYPNREWAILIPAWTVMAVLFTYFVYSTLALAGTPALDEMRSLTDDYTLYPNYDDGRNVFLESTKSGSVPELYDIPIGMVNRVLYQRPSHHDQNTTKGKVKQKRP